MTGCFIKENIVSQAKEPSFRESVDLMYNRAVELIELPPGLKEKIRICDSSYTTSFGVQFEVKSKHLLAIEQFIRIIWNL
jgi:hypothetical protein